MATLGQCGAATPAAGFRFPDQRSAQHRGSGRLQPTDTATFPESDLSPGLPRLPLPHHLSGATIPVYDHAPQTHSRPESP